MSYSNTGYSPHYHQVREVGIGPIWYTPKRSGGIRVLNGLGHVHGGGGWGGGGMYSGDGLPMEPTDFISTPLFGLGSYEGDMQQLAAIPVLRSRVHRGMRGSGDGLDGIIAVL